MVGRAGTCWPGGLFMRLKQVRGSLVFAENKPAPKSLNSDSDSSLVMGYGVASEGGLGGGGGGGSR